MALDAKRKQELEALCNQFRIDVLTVLHSIQTGHPGRVAFGVRNFNGFVL